MSESEPVSPTYGQVAGWHVVGLGMFRHPGQVLTEEPESLGVILRQLPHQLLQLTDGFSLLGGVGGGAARGGAGPADLDEVVVQPERHQRLGQLPHVELHHVGDHVGVDVGQVHQLGSVLKSLAELLHFTLDSTDSVDSLHICSAGVNDGHALQEERGDISTDVQQVLAEIHTEGIHLPQQPAWTAEKMKSLQAFLVCGQAALCTLVTVEVSIFVAFPTLVGSLNLLELVRRCSFGHLTFGLVLVQVWLCILRFK